MSDLFEYLDYRKFLQDYFQGKKQDLSSWSYQRFAEQLGFKAKDFVYRVIKGQKNLSTDSILKITRGLDLDPVQTQYFDTLVKCNQSKSSEEKELYYGLLNTIKTQGRTTNPVQRLRQDQFQFYAKWYHSAIRSLIEMYGFHGDFKALVASLSVRITARQAEASVALLEKLGLIQKSEQGIYTATQKSISTGYDARSILIPAYHKATIELSAKTLEITPVAQRDLSNLTLGISEKTFHQFSEKLRIFRLELMALADQDEDADRVYHLNLHLYPLSEPNLKKGGIG